MKVIMFQERFAPLVESGAKCQTIRPMRRNPVRVGDAVSLRAWTGRAYRSKQRVLREVIVLKVERVSVLVSGIWTGPEEDRRLTTLPHQFAKADGFADWPEMREWFARTHGLPFHGVLIQWA